MGSQFCPEIEIASSFPVVVGVSLTPVTTTLGAVTLNNVNEVVFVNQIVPATVD